MSVAGLATPADALAFLATHGIVLVSARGTLARMTEAIAGEAIKGSWWGHPQGKRIFSILEELSASPEVLVCRLAGDKLTLVHRRLWPQLACVADALDPARIARVTQQHTASGRHINTDTAFPDWVPPEVLAAAASVDRAHALTLFATYLK